MNQTAFQQNYDILNPEQLDAVESLDGPIMVVAGPGTGKTQIISLRTANIILKAWVDPENILITTFTEAGVIALKKRLVKFIGTEAYKVKVCTIHSFAWDVISAFPEKFIEQRASNIIDDIESLEFFTKILDEKIKASEIEKLFHPADRYTYLRDIKDRIGKLKGEGISPSKFSKIIENQRNTYLQNLEDLKSNKRIRDLEKRTAKDKASYDTHITKLEELNMLYQQYQDYLSQHSLYDFSDMINFVVEAMRDDEDLKSYYAEKYQFIMLDEYQDTNNPQNEIMNLILSVWEEKNIMVVGDDDQSIYRFQGANIENMLDFYTLYPSTKFIVLKNNYRSSQSILDISESIISNNDERLVNRLDFLDKLLTSHSQYKDLTQNAAYVLPDENSEKIFIYSKILGNLETNSRVAIIVRSNREVAEWSSFMQSQWLEVESKLKTNILTNKYVEFLLNLIHIIHNPYHSDELFLNLLRSDIIDIENLDVIILARELYIKNYSSHGFPAQLWDSIKNIDDNQLTQKKPYKDIEKITAFRDLLLSLQANSSNISVFFNKLIESIWLVEYIENHGNFWDLEDIFTLFNNIKAWNSKDTSMTLSAMLHKCELHKKYNIIISRQILKKTPSNIEILTAHGSKWLEYDYVYIPGMQAWNWENKRVVDKLKLPLWMVWDGLQFAGMDEKDIKKLSKELANSEDRRLFFVATTRAEQSITYTRPAGKDNKPYIDSPFLLETWLKVETLEDIWDDAILKKSIIAQITWSHALMEVGDDEINYISEFLENYKLSATDLNTFLEDPLIFLQNSVFKYPFVDNEFTIFGKIYHRVLELATMKKQAWEQVPVWYMTESFDLLLDKQIVNEEEKQRLQKKGREGLTAYHSIFEANKNTTLATEYNFRSKNVVFEWVPITGKIDTIEKLDKTSWPDSNSWSLFRESVAVIDYKTWSIKSEGMIKWTDRYWNTKQWYEHGKYYRQLMFYKLLWESDNEFNSQYDIAELALDFVEGKNWEYKYQSIHVSDEDFNEFKQLVTDSWRQMNDLNYWKEVLKK